MELTTGDRIAWHRRRAEMTQEKLAELSKIAQNTLIGLEKSRVSPRVDVLERIAKALGIAAADLLSE